MPSALQLAIAQKRAAAQKQPKARRAVRCDDGAYAFTSDGSDAGRLIDAMGNALADVPDSGAAYLLPPATPHDNDASAATVALGYHRDVLLHEAPGDRYPERPARVRHIRRMLSEACVIGDSWIAVDDDEDPSTADREPDAVVAVAPGVSLLEPLAGAAERVRAVHSTAEYERFFAGHGFAELPTDVFCDPALSLRAVDMSVGLCCAAIDAVAARRSQHAFCAVRPPGHHCGERPNGFCLVNNVVIAAQHYFATAHAADPRVVIVDFDVHHGEGTQHHVDKHNAARAAQRLEPNLFFASLHRYDKGGFFPGTGHPSAVGVGGACVNIGMDTNRKTNEAESICDATFDAFTERVVVPMIRGCGATLVFVSAGFDAAHGDPLGGMSVMHGYARLVLATRAACPTVPLVCVLEGGYNTEAVGQRACDVVQALRCPETQLQSALKHTPPLPPPSWVDAARAAATDDEAAATWQRLREAHEAWVCSAVQRTRDAHAEAPSGSVASRWIGAS